MNNINDIYKYLNNKFKNNKYINIYFTEFKYYDLISLCYDVLFYLEDDDTLDDDTIPILTVKYINNIFVITINDDELELVTVNETISALNNIFDHYYEDNDFKNTSINLIPFINTSDKNIEIYEKFVDDFFKKDLSNIKYIDYIKHNLKQETYDKYVYLIKANDFDLL